MTFFLLCAWGVCIYFALLGYGRTLLRWLGIESASWPLSGLIGASLLIAAGGLLNLAGFIRPAVLIGAVVIGFGLWIFLQYRGRAIRRPSFFEELRQLSQQRFLLLFTLLLFILIAVPVLGNVKADVRTFNFYDDLPAYLTLPAQTIQTGSLPFDPFNERRLSASLGAPYFLQSFMMIFGGVQSIRFADVSLGIVFYAGALLTVFRLLGLSRTANLVLVLLIFLVPVDRWNATFVLLPAALFCCLFLIQIDPSLDERPEWIRSLLLGLTAASLCCLKSNYLPAAILICGFYYLGRFVVEKRVNALREGFLWGAITLALLLPWMLDMKHKEGTLLFPIFGRGYDASAYGLIPLPNGLRSESGFAALWVWITILPTAGPLILAGGAAVAAYRSKWEGKWMVPLCALLLGAAVAIAAIASSTGGESVGRYSLPFQAPALLIFLAFLYRWRKLVPQPPWWFRWMGAVMALSLLLLGYVFGIRHGQYHRVLEDARLLTAPDESWFSPPVEARRVRALQATVPAGERILARLFVSYPFDFQRNQVFVADYTGMAGLPPGVPINETPEVLRKYLLRNRIRYLAYDPTRTALPDDDPATTLSQVLADRQKYGRHGWLYMQVKVANSEQRLFSRLARTYKHLYDDGVVYVLDLQTPGSSTN